jgi:hypothetical protein
LATEAEQSSERSEKQGDVNYEAEDDVDYAIMGVVYNTTWKNRIPLGTELQKDKLRGCRVVEVGYSPARYLTQYYADKKLSSM